MVSVKKWKIEKGQSFNIFHGFRGVKMCKESYFRCAKEETTYNYSLVFLISQLDSMIRLSDKEENYEKEKRKRICTYFSLLLFFYSIVYFLVFS